MKNYINITQETKKIKVRIAQRKMTRRIKSLKI